MKEIIVDLRKINITYLLTLVGTLLTSILIIVIKNNIVYFKWNWIIILSFLSVIIFHEVIHAVGFIIFAKVPIDKVKFGFHKQYYVPYCSADGVISKFGYISALLLPNILLGSIGLIYLFFTNNFLWSIFVTWIVASGSGDYYMLYLVSKYNNKSKFMDHPTEPGFFVIE